jgi:hypothetical protein
MKNIRTSSGITIVFNVVDTGIMKQRNIHIQNQGQDKMIGNAGGFELSQKWIDYLLQQPEHGMGYQRCIVEDKNGVHTDIIVCYSKYVFDASIDNNSIVDVKIQ